MNYSLTEKDIEDNTPIARLTDSICYEDLRVSQDCMISVKYNEIDLGKTQYGFNQRFVDNEANMYFRRMKDFSEMSINGIIDQGVHSLHFYRSDIKGNIKKVFDSIDTKIAKANPMIFHFALNPDCNDDADRMTGVRNARIYFMVGYLGMIHPIFFDPYHELNPIMKHDDRKA